MQYSIHHRASLSSWHCCHIMCADDPDFWDCVLGSQDQGGAVQAESSAAGPRQEQRGGEATHQAKRFRASQ